MVRSINNYLPSKAKEIARKALIPLLHTPIGSQTVLLGPPKDTLQIKLSTSPFGDNRLGNREIEGYLQQYNPKPGDTVVNAGAYHGHLALYLSKKVGESGRIICFEPDRTNRRILNRNIKLNSADNITVIPYGLWSKKEQLLFSVRGSSSRIIPEGTSSIKTIDLDSALNSLQISNIDFIAMDIEGAEIEALAGMGKTLHNNPQLKLAIASYHIVDSEKTCYELEKRFKALTWKAYTGFPNHLTTYAEKAN